MATIDVQIGATADDGLIYLVTTEGSGGTFISNNSFIAFGDGGTSNKRSLWTRFTGITITGGATIDVAYKTYTPNQTKAETTVSSTIWANDVLATAAPTTAAEYWALVKTTASVAWNSIPTFTLDVEINTPSLNAIIQELVDSYTYTSASMQFMHWNNGSSLGAQRLPWDYSGSTVKAPKLHIEYTAGAAATWASAMMMREVG